MSYQDSAKEAVFRARMYRSRRPPVGPLAFLRRLLDQATCPHTHVAALEPQSASWCTESHGGKHTALVLCGCYRCGATFLRDYGA